MLSEAFTTILAALAAATSVAWLCLWLRERGVRPLASLAAAWRDWSGGYRLRKALSLAALAALVSWAGAKPGGEIIELSNNRIIESAAEAGLSSVGADVLGRPQGETSAALSLVRVGTNEVFDFSDPDGATVAEKWRRRGASKDYLRLDFTDWAFPFGDESFSNLVVFAGGRIRLSRDTELCPFAANLGIVPEANWGMRGVSLFWHYLSPSNTLVLTWQNALLERETANPVSFQAELFPSGNAVFRYDLARLGDEGLLTNVVVSAGRLEGQEGREGLEEEGDDNSANYSTIPLFHYSTSLAFKTENELRCDEARAEFDDALGGADPLALPAGSTNSVWEHYVYTGTTNGAFSLPESTASAAVLRVAVSGSGRGELLVGGRAVPLMGEVAPCEASAQRQVLLQVPRGQTVPLYLRADGTLAVSFDSDDFAFGSLPDPAANRFAGRINFPNTEATTPCFHDYVARQTTVSLPAGEGADALACAWAGTAFVAASNVPPRSAVLTGKFDGRMTTPVSYALSHPEYLFGQTTHSQTARFCPPPPDAADKETLRRYGDGGGDYDGVTCWHCAWRECGQGCECCASCRHGEDGSADEPDEPDADDYAVAVTNWPHLGGVLKIREPLRYDRSVFLAVPGGAAPKCCPCPIHATNHVAIVCRSSRLKVVDGSGGDFRSATESTRVRIAGVSPSLAVGDAYVAFATNGAVCLDGEFTVLGVGVRRAGVDLAALDARSPSFGLPVPVTTNFLDAADLELVTKVGLPGGNVHVGFEGASAPFALWVWDYTLKKYHKLASSDGGALDVSLATWRKLVGGATDAATSRTAVRVTAAGAGVADLVFRYWNVIGGKFVEDVARQRLTAVDSPLRADVDRDGRIDAADAALIRAGRPFRFWVNEDTEKGDYAGQVADATPNAADLKVNGRLDLVNLFPVTVDVSQFRRAWGAMATARIRSSSARLRYCVLGDGFSSEDALGLATSSVAAADGTPLEEAALTPLGSAGADVGALSGGSPSSPVALAFEAAKPVGAWSGPEVVVSFGGAEVYRERLPMEIASVDEMYRHADLRGAADGAAFAPTVPDEPWNWPDDETDGRHFVFVHGYNVDAASSRAWARAMFKRLWWAGVRSAFTAVDWKGDSSQVAGVSPNYWANVVNAFKTAPALANLVNALSGEKVMIAHSLGNVLVSSAIQDFGLFADRYCMFNAAVPVEAYDAASEQEDNMVPDVWRRYPPSLYAANWHDHFGETDGRRLLNWRGRFAAVRNAVNFYSPTDEVLANPALADMGGVWSAQEILKGTGLATVFPSVANEGGWGFNRTHTMPLSATELRKTAFSDDELKMSPPFLPFAEDWLHTTNTVSDTQIADVRARILADGIPATSFAAGANAIGDAFSDVNCHDLMTNKDKWPGGRKTDDGQGGEMNAWRHSDVKNLAYPYVYLLFRILVTHE